MKRLRIGIVGLGTIAQAIHLPNLLRLWERFEVARVCDLDAEMAMQIARALGSGARVSADPRPVFDDPELDAVFILASGPHAPMARVALEAGKHVFVEKPLCLTLAEATELDDAARSAKRVLQVGYMKLYDPVMSVATRAVRSIADPRLLQITVVQPDEASLVGHLSIRRPSAAPAAGDTRRAYETESTRLAIGDLPPAFGSLYRGPVLGAMVHQVAVVRHLVGRLPADVIYADAWPFDPHEPADTRPELPSVLVVADIDPQFRLEIAWVWSPGMGRWSERYELIGPDSRLTLEMPTPYALDQQAVLQIERASESDQPAVRMVGDHRTGFQAELEAFHDAVTGKTPYPSGALEARDDTRFLQRLVAHVAERRGFVAGGESRWLG